LQQSVPSPSEVQATFAATLFDEWCRHGLRDVVICPGSRSTPLVVAASERDELQLHVRLDERSAGFFAIGRSLVTRRPVVVVVTSGTAAAELHAAVAEADLSGVALVVVTADRPQELHGVGAPQTINQRHLYATMVRRFEEPGVARLDAASSWRALASRLWLDAAGATSYAGPVHLNAAFVEPLLADPLELPPGRPGAAPWRVVAQHEVRAVEVPLDGRRVLAVVGHGVNAETVADCVALEWVVLGDATARGTLSYFDPLLRDEEFATLMRPDVVVRLGGLPASKVLEERLRQWGAPTVALDGAGPVANPDGLVNEMLHGLPDRDSSLSRGDPTYAALWSDASERVGTWLDESEGDDVWLSEPVVARALVAASERRGAPLVVGSSMPVRDVEWWSAPRQVATYANRGANGIDGVVSTVLGVAAGSCALGLVGDVTLLHDVSGLVDGLGDAQGTCVLVVANNRGGGIFSFLPQASALSAERFEHLFATPRAHDLVEVAQAFGHVGVSVATRGELRAAIDEGAERPGLTVVVAQLPSREENVRYHEALNGAIAQCWKDDAG
jgi:2-succinyl-5-enolpyruvyl-6-hydroxy-3-cyclohexene-1-carboxylate synthase